MGSGCGKDTHLYLQLLPHFLQNIMVEPQEGDQRCGSTGSGFMAPKQQLCGRLLQLLTHRTGERKYALRVVSPLGPLHHQCDLVILGWSGHPGARVGGGPHKHNPTPLIQQPGCILCPQDSRALHRLLYDLAKGQQLLLSVFSPKDKYAAD